jgi:hypothetical protein
VFGAGKAGTKFPGTDFCCAGAGGCGCVAAVGRTPIVTATANAAIPATSIPPAALPTSKARPAGTAAASNSSSSSPPYSIGSSSESSSSIEYANCDSEAAALVATSSPVNASVIGAAADAMVGSPGGEENRPVGGTGANAVASPAG